MKNWIVADPEHLGGKPAGAGHAHFRGADPGSARRWVVSDIVDTYPSLTEESVRGALAELAHTKELQPC